MCLHEVAQRAYGLAVTSHECMSMLGTCTGQHANVQPNACCWELDCAQPKRRTHVYYHYAQTQASDHADIFRNIPSPSAAAKATSEVHHRCAQTGHCPGRAGQHWNQPAGENPVQGSSLLSPSPMALIHSHQYMTRQTTAAFQVI